MPLSKIQLDQIEHEGSSETLVSDQELSNATDALQVNINNLQVQVNDINTSAPPSGGLGITLPINFRVKSSSWTTAQIFYFPGIANQAAPFVFRAYGLTNPNNKEGFVRIYDATNGQIISDELHWDNEQNITLKETSSFFNLPNEPAAFEVQVKRGRGGNFTIKYAELR